MTDHAAGPASGPASFRLVTVAVSVVAAVSCASLVLFLAVDGPFGTLNDVGNALLALLCGVLVLHRPGRPMIAGIALIGSGCAVLGSYLVMSDTTGYYLAGLVSAFGFGLMGVWVAVAAQDDRLPARRTGTAAGVVMAVGLVGLPAIVQGVDDQDSAPSWLLATGFSWAGSYLLLPLWAARAARASGQPVSRGRGRR